ncbi:uncharacterized protein TEOVI_000778900 [Trypanosoma equiperdum]|uniref:Uncharacterized protein n=1 Tax=Trypanosoma equiperdum TaxID=5694 RepID=A0A1G4I4H8_TRYEQ|nr:hypothetical protein, conserved [Trypanosoma equiperdum]
MNALHKRCKGCNYIPLGWKRFIHLYPLSEAGYTIGGVCILGHVPPFCSVCCDHRQRSNTYHIFCFFAAVAKRISEGKCATEHANCLPYVVLRVAECWERGYDAPKREKYAHCGALKGLREVAVTVY